ncbi:aldehyde dehydrogenase (NAD(P)+) [Paraoerskovia marina]|uniref:Aldehyde dehydrogenase (NAD(P)+) n=1 Tax=Paraoerskovia marina TaxID=545619 RepID=A0A1H1LWZ0_9CELL|nr:aldehyde dehydrogenase family protein [Paraoerskovia marina]SDR79066.1 aldehyde dehydrogenase (NAD(P)+) [Paraoerskovia marina]
MNAADSKSSTSTSGLEEAARDRLDRAVADAAAGAEAWARMPLSERTRLIEDTHRVVRDHAEEWATTASEIKQLDLLSPLVGEEWTSGPYATLSGFAATAESMAGIVAGRSPLSGARFGRAPGNRVTVPVMPHGAKEALLLPGFSAEVWLQPGVSAEEAIAEAGLGQRTPGQGGGVGVVLGAGNITAIPPLDVLYEIVAFNRSVVLKLNPIMGGMQPVFEAALEPLIRAGMLRIVQGGAAEGSYLVQHPGIEHVHITGSAATHDAIVWGTGDERERRKEANEPLLSVPITSELGGVSPIIVVPGEWSEEDLRYQAEHVATQRLHNSGHNCIAGQVVLLSEDWDQREAFLHELRAALERAPRRPAWYPRSEERFAAAAETYPDLERFADATRVLVEVDADSPDASVIETTEYFAPILGVLSVPGTGQRFLDEAVTRANRDLLGTLGANIIVEPKQRRAMGPAFDESVARLRYGTIGINAWTGLGFLTARATWGAFPGHTLQDVQSGIGVVHNALLIDRAERTVVTGPFRPFPRSVMNGELALFPKPPWFVTARSARTTGRLLADFAGNPSWAKFPAIFLSAFRA